MTDQSVAHLMAEANLAKQLAEAREALKSAKLDLELDDAPRDVLEGRVAKWHDLVAQLEQEHADAAALVKADGRKP